jgi:hypothetical protein
MIFVVPSDCLIRINNLLIRSLLLESSAEVFLPALIIGASEKKGNWRFSYCRGLNPSRKKDAKGGKYAGEALRPAAFIVTAIPFVLLGAEICRALAKGELAYPI